MTGMLSSLWMESLWHKFTRPFHSTFLQYGCKHEPLFKAASGHLYLHQTNYQCLMMKCTCTINLAFWNYMVRKITEALMIATFKMHVGHLLQIITNPSTGWEHRLCHHNITPSSWDAGLPTQTDHLGSLTTSLIIGGAISGPHCQHSCDRNLTKKGVK